MTTETKPKMLFVDDRTKRLMYALNELSKKYDVTIAATVPQALRLMSQYNFDFISLDHDLDGHDFQDPDSNNCGMEIVRYILKTGWPPIKKPVFYVHSKNLFGANLMATTLIKAGYEAYYNPISEKVEYMQYDEKGLPK